MTGPGDDGGDRCGIAADQGFDAAVAAVPHPAANPQTARRVAHVIAVGDALHDTPDDQAARYAWSLLLVRIYEVFPLQCPKCGGEMRIIAFIIEA